MNETQIYYVFPLLLVVLKRPRGGGGGGGGLLPYNRLMGMCRWIGLHFNDWIDYHGVAFSVEGREFHSGTKYRNGIM